MADQIVRCEKCGLESKINIQTEIIQSIMIPKDEMKRLCKLAKSPRFDFQCPYFNEAVRAATLPSGLRR